MSLPSSRHQRPARRPFAPPRLERLEDRDQPSAANVLAFGADAGGLPYVRLFDPTTGTQVRAFLAYDAGFRGGVSVATGDVNGDGVPDVVTGAGPGGAPHVKVFDGRTGALLSSFFAYNARFAGGVTVAVGDVTGDGKADIVTGAGAGGGPHVRVFDLSGRLESEFFAYSPTFAGGVRVAVGDTTGDRQCDIITAAGAGGGPHVKVFDGATGTVKASFMAYSPAFAGGVYVTAADVDGDGQAEIITGAGAGGGPHVEVFGSQGGLRTGLMAFDPAFRGGVRVGAGDVNGDGTLDLVAAAGPGGSPQWRAFDAATRAPLAGGAAFTFPFAGGVTVAGNCPAPISQANEDAVIGWNAITLDAFRTGGTAPTVASRALAMVQTAVYDAVNAIVPLHASYQTTLTAPPTADMTAAAAQAAHDVLAALFPAQAATFDADLATWLGKVADGQAKTDGVTVGQQAAAAILALRANDGSNATSTYTPTNAPGHWQPTPPGFLSPVTPQWGGVTTFGIPTANQFLPPGPPALDSQQYADDLNLTEQVGGVDSTVRTQDQTDLSHFWADIAGTMTPPGHWNQIAQDVSLQKGLSIAENALLFAKLDIALADAGIVCWDAKYIDDFWRPVTAIRNADQDGNPDTTADPTWTPLWVTPPFPEYSSGHSTFSGAADSVLTAYFGPHVAFTDRGDPAQPFTRSFTSFTQAADEAGMSRVYGGIHFMSANLDGLASGRAIGQYVANNLLT